MIRYGIDIKTPTTIPGQDGWAPVMENSDARMTFLTTEGVLAYADRLTATNGQLELRIVEIQRTETVLRDVD